MTAKPPSPRPRPVAPTPFAARGWGDPHFVGFDGSRFDFHGRGWTVLLESHRTDLSVVARLDPWTRPGTTVMRAFHVTAGGVHAIVELPNSEAWTAPPTAFADGRPVDRTGLVRGVRIDRNVARPGRDGRIVIERPGLLRIAIVQRWPASLARPADFLNFELVVAPTLPPPVVGLLGPSFVRAVAARAHIASAEDFVRASGEVA